MPRPLPPAAAARARAWLAAGGPAAEPRDAATVVLLRQRPAGPAVYLLRRRATMAFAAGMSVFPGGAVDPRDADPALPWVGPDPAAWAATLSAGPDLARALLAAAVRETFEETGVLLAGPSEHTVVGDVSGPDWEADRVALLDGRVALHELLAARHLRLRSDLLRAWAHWITPEYEPRRYDTRFFVAALPTGQRCRDVGGEADHAAWWRPVDALGEHRAGRLALMPPTLRILEELADFDTVDAVLAAGAARPVAPVRPQVVAVGDAVHLLLPHEEVHG